MFGEVDRVWVNLIAGAAGGMAALVCVYPFTTFQARMAAADAAKYKHTSLLGTAVRLWQRDGFASWYRGMGLPLMIVPIVQPFRFTLYGHLMNMLSTDEKSKGWDNRWRRLVASCGMGGVLSILNTPMEVIIMFSKMGEAHGGSYLGTARRLMQQHGVLRGLYASFPVVVMRDIVGTAVLMVTAEELSAIVRKNTNTPSTSWLHGAAPYLGGAGGGLACWTVVYPLHLVATRRQQNLIGHGEAATASSWSVAKHVLRDRGIAGMYAGFGPQFARAAPNQALVMGVFATVQKLLNERYHDDDR